MHVYIPTYIHTCIHTYIHTHTHTTFRVFIQLAGILDSDEFLDGKVDVMIEGLRALFPTNTIKTSLEHQDEIHQHAKGHGEAGTKEREHIL